MSRNSDAVKLKEVLDITYSRALGLIRENRMDGETHHQAAQRMLADKRWQQDYRQTETQRRRMSAEASERMHR
jgi:hypothetical protein